MSACSQGHIKEQLQVIAMSVWSASEVAENYTAFERVTGVAQESTHININACGQVKHI